MDLIICLLIVQQLHNSLFNFNNFPALLFSFCRVKVSQDGQFLHYVFPYQFLDSPEWESLQPSEEGTFQVMFFIMF